MLDNPAPTKTVTHKNESSDQTPHESVNNPPETDSQQFNQSADQSHMSHNFTDMAGHMVYAHVAGCWVSGTIQNHSGSALTIKLVTGSTVIRQESEIRTTSPRLDDPKEWPL